MLNNSPNGSHNTIPSLQRSTVSAKYSSFLPVVAEGSGKRPKTVQVWDRDIVYIPDSKSSQKIPYPCGKYRSQLGEDGLIGKIRLISKMNEEGVKDEIRSVF